MRAATFHALSQPKHPQEWDARAGLVPRSHPDARPVVARSVPLEDLDRGSPPANARLPVDDPLRDAWLEMLLPYFSEPDCWFVTLTYADAYGFPHGIVSASNALRDFRRFIGPWDDVRSWVDCAEPHQARPIWHHHALIAGLSDIRADCLRQDWASSRGFADVSPLHDGGVSYATKYALKGSDSVSFDWQLT